MYDKTDRLPPAGSLREALFLSIWLRRQDQEVNKIRTITAALADVVGGKDNANAREAYKAYFESVYPFAVKQRGDTDKKMAEVLKKWTDQGPIMFRPLDGGPLRNLPKSQVPEDFKRKLQERRKK